MSESADTTTTTPNRPLAWVSRDARLIMLARSLRAFSQASVALLFAAYLDLLGFSLAQIGLFITIGMAGSTFFSILVVVFGELVGRRLLMTAFTLLTSVSGLSLALFDNYLLLALLTFIGALNLAAGNPGGPVQPVERASIAESVTATKRTDLFAVYTIATTSARALGTLAAGLPVVFQSVFGMEELSSFKVMFIAYAVTALIAGVLYALLSPNSEAKDRTRRITNPFTLPSRQIIFTLTTLLAIDSFATRMVVHTLVALWFLDKFGVDLGQIAFIFFIANLLNAASAWIAAKIANRWGPTFLRWPR